MKQTLDELASRASKILRIDIGVDGRKAYYYAEETRKAYWLTREDLTLAESVKGEQDRYSLWCASTTSNEMSARSMRRLIG